MGVFDRLRFRLRRAVPTQSAASAEATPSDPAGGSGAEITKPAKVPADGASPAAPEFQEREIPEADERQRALAAEYLGVRSAETPEDAVRHLVIVHGYPRIGAEYGNGFVHRRVKLYQRAGVAVDVVVSGPKVPEEIYEYDGVRVLSIQGPGLRAFLGQVETSGVGEGGGLRRRYRSVSTHFLNEYLWACVGKFRAHIDWYVYVHGFEARSWERMLCNVGLDDPALPAHQAATDRRRLFWRHVVDAPDAPAGYVFVSDWWRAASQEDMRVTFPGDRSHVINNVIDDSIFSPADGPMRRTDSDRFKLVWVRSASRPNYAADLAARALEALSRAPEWRQIQVTVIGSGPHMDEFTRRFGDAENVRIEERFAAQTEVAELYRSHGFALVPTRMDTQGVSRDEAMACACVPVTNAVAAIPEFIDGSESVLAPAEDPEAMAAGILALMREPEEFMRRCQRAYENVAARSFPEQTTEREITLMSLTA